MLVNDSKMLAESLANVGAMENVQDLIQMIQGTVVF